MPSKLANVGKGRTLNLPRRDKTEKTEKPEKKKIEDTFELLPLTLIRIDSNIRGKEDYDEESLSELAESMKRDGQLQPARVYENEDGDYTLIVGHRRFLSASRAGLNYLKCIITEKPDPLDLLYIQAQENEQRKDISSADRERYILGFLELGQTPEQIYTRMGKSKGWFSQMKMAGKFREQHGKKFDNAGIELTTQDAVKMAGMSDGEVDTVIDELIEAKAAKAPKGEIVKKLSKTKQNRKPKAQPESKTVAEEPEEGEGAFEAADPFEQPVEFGRECQLNAFLKLDEEARTCLLNCQVLGNVVYPALGGQVRETIEAFMKEQGFECLAV